MIENRATRACAHLKADQLYLVPRRTLDCVVRNLSETGACLEVASPVGIPDDFTLQIKSEPTKRDRHVAAVSAN